MQSQLFEDYADQAGYYDICLLIYHAADHREKADIRATWQNWIQQLHDEATAAGEAKPYEVVAERVRSFGRRVHLSESVFDICKSLKPAPTDSYLPNLPAERVQECGQR